MRFFDRKLTVSISLTERLRRNLLASIGGFVDRNSGDPCRFIGFLISVPFRKLFNIFSNEISAGRLPECSFNAGTAAVLFEPFVVATNLSLGTLARSVGMPGFFIIVGSFDLLSISYDANKLTTQNTNYLASVKIKIYLKWYNTQTHVKNQIKYSMEQEKNGASEVSSIGCVFAWKRRTVDRQWVSIWFFNCWIGCRQLNYSNDILRISYTHFHPAIVCCLLNFRLNFLFVEVFIEFFSSFHNKNHLKW